MLAQFKNFQADRMDLDELVALAAYGRALRTEYEAVGLDEPEFIDIQLKSLRREIHSRNADKLEKTLREKRSRLEALKSPTEKRAEIKKEIAALEKTLANAG
jgi:hypothetical protein